MRTRTISLLFAMTGAGAYAFGSHSTLAQPATTIQWGCDAPAARTCFFSIVSAAGSIRSFSLLSGRRMEVPGVVPGRDTYLVSVDTPNLGDLIHCRQLVALGHLCQRKIVDFGYND